MKKEKNKGFKIIFEDDEIVGFRTNGKPVTVRDLGLKGLKTMLRTELPGVSKEAFDLIYFAGWENRKASSPFNHADKRQRRKQDEKELAFLEFISSKGEKWKEYLRETSISKILIELEAWAEDRQGAPIPGRSTIGKYKKKYCPR